MTTAARDARRRVVLLGASNLTLAFPTVMARLRAGSPEPLEVLVAHGHGRSFGLPTRVLGRWLPPIAECGLWRRLQRTSCTTTTACVTDVGNDVMYGASVDEIVGWVERDLDRLAAAGARVVLTRVPLASIAMLSPARYRIARTLLFPGRRIALPALLSELARLDERLETLTRTRDLRSVVPDPTWYGWDPIHILRRKRADAWRAILGHDASPAGIETPVLARAERRSLTRLRPEYRRIFSIEQKRVQPAVEWPDGTTISAY